MKQHNFICIKKFEVKFKIVVTNHDFKLKFKIIMGDYSFDHFFFKKIQNRIHQLRFYDVDVYVTVMYQIEKNLEPNLDFEFLFLKGVFLVKTQIFII